MSSVVVIDKKSQTESTVNGSRIILDKASKVHTQLYRSDVAEFVQDGNDLILKLKNGKTMVIVNFFVEHDDETSDVLFKDDAGIPWLPLLLGGAGVAGGLALASGGGGDNNGGAASAPKNHVPVAGLSNQPIETQEDHPKKGQITDVTDKDGDKLTYKVGEAPKNGTVTVDEKTGAYTYTPNPDYHGDDKFTVVVSDGNGGEVTVTVPVVVIPNNDDSVSGTITDDLNKGGDLEYKTGDDPKNGTVTINKDGSYTYTPKPGFTGDDSFTIVVSDGKGGQITVPVTVNPKNDDPVVGKTTDDLDKGLDLEYKAGDDPKNGTVTINKDGSYTYTPKPGFTGDDSFTVVISDGNGGEVTVTVPVTVTPVNDVPTAEAEQGFTTDEDTEHKGQIIAEDKDGDDLTYVVKDQPEHGTVDLD
ncbi:Ig-like domain-containing protein, partial [Wohlfahrtiimonas chitiniclastica]|uniref:Ig-like domain-containing protein n=1 Tax=Wohlfahrtiimonas chitiniclastica TaxID=400946 RepID=UPI001BD07742